jgi:hypothetical protein
MRQAEDREVARWHWEQYMRLQDQAHATRDPAIRSEAAKHYDRTLYYAPTMGCA